ncbi:MAG: ATP-dependent DNA helicase, partial [uncultured bacterium]
QARVENVEELFNSIKEFEGDALGGVYEEEYDQPNGGDNIQKESPGTQSAGILDSESSIQRSEISDLSYSGTSTQMDSNLVLLENFLENISLMSAVDEKFDKEDNNKISLMTVHSAKGLEFPFVYVIGMEENLFPSLNSSSSESEIEEERRLFYVALTRAKKQITLSYAQSRFRWGANVNYPPSRFLKEIDKKFVNWPAQESEKSPSLNFEQWNAPSDDLNYSGGSAGSSNKFGNQSWRSERNSSGSSYSGSGSRTSGTNNSQTNKLSQVSTGVPAFSNSSSQSRSRTTPFIPDPVEKLREKMRVEHERFGYGSIFSLEGDVLNMRAVVDFESGGRKTLLLKFAKLRIAE